MAQQPQFRRLLDAAIELSHALGDITDLLKCYHDCIDQDGTDSLAALDFLEAIRRKEMVIQQFTNAHDDIMSEDL